MNEGSRLGVYGSTGCVCWAWIALVSAVPVAGFVCCAQVLAAIAKKPIHSRSFLQAKETLQESAENIGQNTIVILPPRDSVHQAPLVHNFGEGFVSAAQMQRGTRGKSRGQFEVRMWRSYADRSRYL
jgi:hypothetical protein